MDKDLDKEDLKGEAVKYTVLNNELALNTMPRLTIISLKLLAA